MSRSGLRHEGAAHGQHLLLAAGKAYPPSGPRAPSGEGSARRRAAGSRGSRRRSGCSRPCPGSRRRSICEKTRRPSGHSAMPRSTTLWDFTPTILCPLNAMEPESGLMRPATVLSVVDSAGTVGADERDSDFSHRRPKGIGREGRVKSPATFHNGAATKEGGNDAIPTARGFLPAGRATLGERPSPLRQGQWPRRAESRCVRAQRAESSRQGRAPAW